MSDLKKQIRPTIASYKCNENDGMELNFQNEVLRPIIKLQHELIIMCFENHLSIHGINWHEQGQEQKEEFIEESFSKNLRFKANIMSLIVGLFTIEEYANYLEMTSKINKRINSIIKIRISTFYITNFKK